MKKLLLFSLLLTANIAFSANWVKTGSGNTFGDFNAYIDISSIKKVDSSKSKQVKFLEKQDFKKTRTTYQGKKFIYTISSITADCIAQKYTSPSISLYTKNGNIVNSASIPYDYWIKPEPNSIGEYEIELACKIAGY